MIPPTTDDDAARDAWREFLGALKTEPLTAAQLAEWFRVNRKTMGQILRNTRGVERCGRKYRVPLRSMPPAYLADRGVFPG